MVVGRAGGREGDSGTGGGGIGAISMGALV